MMKKLLIAFSVVVGLVLIFAIFIALQPGDFRVTRSATMAATPAQIFPHINDLHLWQDWSPWAKIDPNATARFEGPDSGEGAKFYWDGNDEVGAGSMTIVESQPDEYVKIHLQFTRPFDDEGYSETELESTSDGTQVTWSMYGKNNFIGRIVCLFMDMDEMIGSQYEKGLASLKQIVESTPDATPSETPDKAPAEEAA